MHQGYLCCRWVHLIPVKKIVGRGFTDTPLLIRGGEEIEHMKKWGGGLGMTTTLLCDCSFYLTIRIFMGRIIHSQLSIEPYPP